MKYCLNRHVKEIKRLLYVLKIASAALVHSHCICSLFLFLNSIIHWINNMRRSTFAELRTRYFWPINSFICCYTVKLQNIFTKMCILEIQWKIQRNSTWYIRHMCNNHEHSFYLAMIRIYSICEFSINFVILSEKNIYVVFARKIVVFMNKWFRTCSPKKMDEQHMFSQKLDEWQEFFCTSKCLMWTIEKSYLVFCHFLLECLF